MKRLAKDPRTYFVLVLILIGFFSERSGYSIRDVKTINWEVVLMLSPWGLLNNLVLQSIHYLQPYYFQATDRGALFSDPPMMALLISIMALAFTGLYFLRKQRDQK